MNKAHAAKYSNDELARLREIHCEIVRDHILNYAKGGAIWQRTQGIVADVPAGVVLRIADDAMDESQMRTKDAIRDLFTHIGAYIAPCIQQNDAAFFEQMGIILKARAEGRPLKELTAKELGIKQAKGRKRKPIDLSRAFPLALFNATLMRSRDHAAAGMWTDSKITRDELLGLIQDEQKKAGLKKPPRISKPELSRWITKFNFGEFMAEQPIARKARKPD